MAIANEKIYLDAAQRLKKFLTSSEEFRKDRPERAFIKWYTAARFGNAAKPELLDGSDGGVDAIVRIHDNVFVYQSKYEVKPRLHLTKRDEIAGFEKVERLLNGTDEKEFDAWLLTIKKHAAKESIIKLKKEIETKRHRVKFVFITTSRNTFASSKIEIEDAANLLALWDLYEEGFTPPAEPLHLTLKGHWEKTDSSDDGRYKTLVGLADTSDFRRAMADDPQERLFAQNIRTALRSTINDEIKKTYEKEPDTFWLGNNGVYIICRKAEKIGKEDFVLKYPSVINGYQTLKSIAASKKNESCNILVRILEMNVISDPEILSQIVRRTNNQNPINPLDLLAHDPFQLNVARFLDRFGIYYERRKNEWSNLKKDILSDHEPVTIKQLGQWLAAVEAGRNKEIGFGVARSRVTRLFLGNNYDILFDAFDAQLRSERYQLLPVIVWAGLFVDNFITWQTNKPLKSRLKISRLLFVRALVDAVRNNYELRYKIIDKVRSSHFGYKKTPSSLVPLFKSAILVFIRLQKFEEKKNGTDFSNFFKDNILTNRAYEKAFSQARLRAWTAAFKKKIGEIV